MTAEAAIITILSAGYIFLLFGGLAYFLPTLIAVIRKHSNVFAIFLVNFLVGWTLIGWFIALIWAFTSSRSETIIIEKNNNSPNNDTSPLKLLQERYARGEITESEYQRMKDELES